MNINRTFIIKALAVATLAAVSLPASADRHDGNSSDRHDGGFNERHDDFRDHDVFRDHRDIRRFDRHDYNVWRTGGWQHGRHDGRLGWWWIVAGTWYFYPEPVYPYPDPYTPPVIVTRPTPQPIEPVAPPPAQVWYFCTSANGYYPYVSSCPDGWKSVPATPTPPAVSPSAPPNAPAQ